MNNNLPQVAIVGRMNVGKSTLFNRLADNARSITLDYEGVTRDVIKDTVTWQKRQFEMVDTGGIILHKIDDKILEQVRNKALSAVEKADVVVFMCDGTVGVVPDDRMISDYLHKINKPVILVVNKGDTKATTEHEYEFLGLGYGQPLIISAQHGTGIGELLENILAHLPIAAPTKKDEVGCRVMFLGRPNVGKSSLMNALLQEERSIVADEPGTTREALSEKITFYQEHIVLTDTPGIRRQRAIDEPLESLMVKSSFTALRDSDIILLMIDASEGRLVDQELKLGFYAFTEQYKALILLVNKQDLATEQSTKELENNFDYYNHLMKKIPVLSISCKTGKNIGKILPLIARISKNYSQRIPDEAINRLFVSMLQRKPLMHKQQPLQVHRACQLATSPITIGLEVNHPEWFGESQLAFFENLLRAEYDLTGVPVKFIVRKKL